MDNAVTHKQNESNGPKAWVTKLKPAATEYKHKWSVWRTSCYSGGSILCYSKTHFSSLGNKSNKLKIGMTMLPIAVI